ncbi:hypothetical protein, partial [Serratia marcescens]|uniref:hypothetical protein n=1 Tax=Serratia marcescens TaxID=615 RepID=UPI001CA468A6
VLFSDFISSTFSKIDIIRDSPAKLTAAFYMSGARNPSRSTHRRSVMLPLTFVMARQRKRISDKPRSVKRRKDA